MRPRLLILRALGLGDLLTGLPALRALKDAFPEHLRVLAAAAWLEPLARLSGAVDAVLPTEPLGRVAMRSPAIAVNLHGRGPQSHHRLLETGPGRLMAFSHPAVAESAGMPAWRADEHEVRRWCRLLEESGVPADPGRLSLPVPERPHAVAARGATLLHPGAASEARRWPVERWIAVARSELGRGRGVFVTGGPGEEELALALAEGAGLPAANVLTGGDLLDLAATVAAAARVACGDTGVAHLATALGRPSVVLFGPVSPAHWGPPPGRPHIALWAGRTADPHARRPDPGLLEIGVADVVQALERLDRVPGTGSTAA